MNNVKPSSQVYDQPVTYKHTDPPWLWMTVFIGSISLHLLVFWFLRSSDQFQPWIPQSRQDQIAIDLIEIPPPTASKPTTVKSQPTPSVEDAVTSSLPKTTVTTPENPGDQEINSDVNFAQQPDIQDTPVNTQPVKPTPTPTFTPQPTPTFTPQPTPTFTPQPTPTENIPLNDLPWNRRQEVELGKGTLLPNEKIVSESPTPTPEENITPTPEENITPTPEETTTAQAGGVIANIAPLLRDEIEELRQDGKLRVDALPDVIAEYQGRPTKELEINIIPGDSELKAANILASLVIDKNGQFVQVVIINIEPGTVVGKKSVYEQVLNEIFQQESFVAAYNQDGTKPELSNLYVRIKIEPINQSQSR